MSLHVPGAVSAPLSHWRSGTISGEGHRPGSRVDRQQTPGAATPTGGRNRTSATRSPSISKEGVTPLMSNVMAKLNRPNRTFAVVRALENGRVKKGMYTDTVPGRCRS
jgi:hypothetical protein